MLANPLASSSEPASPEPAVPAWGYRRKTAPSPVPSKLPRQRRSAAAPQPRPETRPPSPRRLSARTGSACCPAG